MKSMFKAAIIPLALSSLMFSASAVQSQTSINLSNYYLAGRYALPTPANTTPPSGGNLLAEEASAVTYNRDTGTLFIVGDGGRAVVQVSTTGSLIDSMTLPAGTSPQNNEFYDTEGLAYVGGGRFVMTEERYRTVVQFSYAPNSTLTRSATQTVDLGTNVGNTGLEGIAYDPLTSGFVVVNQEAGTGGSLQRIFQTTVDFSALTASNGSSTTVNANALFNAANIGFTALSDVYALSNVNSFTGQPLAGNVLVVSLSGQVKEFDRSGTLLSTLNIAGGAQPQAEGLTMDDNGVLYIVGEAGSGATLNQSTLFVYAPIPEPAEYGMLLAGLGLIGAIARRRRTA
jgi:uncharacterized protein